jgi:hypothetical protein
MYSLKKFTPLLLVLGFTLSACTAMQNLTVDDLKKPENLRREKVFSLTIPQIQKAIFDYSSKCTPVKNIVVDPSNPKFGTIATDFTGLTQRNVGILIEFTETSRGTEAKGYAHYAHWTEKGIDRTFLAIENPTTCK